jgi:hypothetical protein
MAARFFGKGVVALGLCLLVMMAMAADKANATTCNLASLMPCLPAVEGAHPRASASCCRVVQTVDKNCLCAQLKSGTYPKQMIEKALLLPKKCKRTNLAGFRCGGEYLWILLNPALLKPNTNLWHSWEVRTRALHYSSTAHESTLVQIVGARTDHRRSQCIRQ